MTNDLASEPKKVVFWRGFSPVFITMRPEHHALATELTNIFQKSLRENASAEDCAELWKCSDATAKANRFLEINSEAAEAFRARRSPIAVINRPSLVHMFGSSELMTIAYVGIWTYCWIPTSLGRFLTRSFGPTIAGRLPHLLVWL